MKAGHGAMMYDDLLVKVILQGRARTAVQTDAADRRGGTRSGTGRKRRARLVAYPRTHDRRPSERKAA